MKNIYSSATKITLLLLVTGLVIFTAVGIEINQTYATSLQLVLAFYFGQKVNEASNKITNDTTTI